VVVNYFSKLFSYSNPGDFNEALRGVHKRVTVDMSRELEKGLTASEIKRALDEIHPIKAPGSDGLHALFFKKFWDIIGEDVVLFVKRAWNEDINLRPINQTSIVVIPKVQNPKQISQFRPISLCNVLYKILSKTIAKRLKRFLPCLISEQQSAFVPKTTYYRQCADSI